jgi:hypothetical protein
MSDAHRETCSRCKVEQRSPHCGSPDGWIQDYAIEGVSRKEQRPIYGAREVYCSVRCWIAAKRAELDLVERAT